MRYVIDTYINFYKLNLTLRVFRFCSAMKAILEHGMKKSMIMGGSSHPWLFIEEATRKEIEKDFRSVYARLVLCKTFRYVGAVGFEVTQCL